MRQLPDHTSKLVRDMLWLCRSVGKLCSRLCRTLIISIGSWAVSGSVCCLGPTAITAGNAARRSMEAQPSNRWSFALNGQIHRSSAYGTVQSYICLASGCIACSDWTLISRCSTMHCEKWAQVEMLSKPSSISHTAMYGDTKTTMQVLKLLSET